MQWGAAHLSALAVIAFLALAGWRLPFSSRQRVPLRLGLATLLLLNEAFWHLWHAVFGFWTVRTMLPLHLCNLMVLLSTYTLWTRSQAGYEVIYLLGVPAVSQVLLTPALGPYGFPHSLFFQIFISHGGTLLAALYLTLGEGMRPRSWRSVGRVTLWGTVYAGFIFVFNQWIGGNYLFLAYKPPAATLLDYLGPWPWYILSMWTIGLALTSGIYGLTLLAVKPTIDKPHQPG